jgi:TetR/AcrR family transcriptional regulator, transcriptional repressor for nem operon
MVKVTKDVSQKYRADLVQAAGQFVRAKGIGEASVGAIAGQVGLTHGAAYRHFASKDALVAAAIRADFDKIVQLLQGIEAKGGILADYISAYLALDHRDYFAWGCPAAPLASEVGRTSAQIREAFAAGVQRNIEAIASLSRIPVAAEAESYATSTFATLTGAMALARALAEVDPEASQKVLDTALATLLVDPRSCRARPENVLPSAEGC